MEGRIRRGAGANRIPVPAITPLPCQGDVESSRATHRFAHACLLSQFVGLACAMRSGCAGHYPQANRLVHFAE
jgi:hypothetical protein